jgi:hypothetical protein
LQQQQHNSTQTTTAQQQQQNTSAGPNGDGGTACHPLLLTDGYRPPMAPSLGALLRREAFTVHKAQFDSDYGDHYAVKPFQHRSPSP